MAVRRCTTSPGFGTCCRAAQQGLLNRPFQITDSKGNVRCAECTTAQSQSKDPRKRGRTIFLYRFHKNQECGIGPNGCPYLGQGGAQQQLGAPPPGFQLQP
jgi:hypothetical protein